MKFRQILITLVATLALTLELFAANVWCAPLNIDFGRASAGSPTQAGYTPYNIADPAGVAFSDSSAFTSDLGLGNSVTVTVLGSTNSYTRNYPALVGGPDVALTNLLQDHVFLNAAGTMTLRLSNLKDGRYNITTYHHNSSGQAGSIFDLSLTDGEVTNQLLYDDVQESQGTSPNPALSLPFSFRVVGGSDVDIILQTGGGGHAGFNGFNLDKFPPIPEPSSLGLLTLGAMGLIRRKRRNQVTC